MYNPFVGYRLTSPFGYRIHPVYKTKKFHKGVDLVTPSNGPIYAFVAGEVIHAKEGAKGSGFGGYGITVAIKDNKGYLHCYAHLSIAAVKVGQRVERGQMIGRQGSTGVSTGPHLHYEIRKKSSPSYGFTSDESGVVEPTQYLMDYYVKELPKVEVKDANAIIDKYLKPAYGVAKTASEKKEIGRLADALRVASGQPKQNS
ncbi:M23 family metallopeptidase [Paenibacillus macerans]|uniref:Peptidoglycan DD-metalloendopeptidase family protein n=1 Tax=Paenibacillus macerans TaxID=44252 RepID=A0A6N8F3J8_PAEMA|nr:M23 family metallopeptidase [Paenibacillus macerans]MEC0136108.1 M23 family metallopeptidase [Paenibacillus macerans]MUG26495.1 peptidoglycan DD-metalloendopeptidase family protein [Paenibacillus macerans]